MIKIHKPMRGTVIYDHEADELRSEGRWMVWDRGRWRELRIRVGRGLIRDVEAPMDAEVIDVLDAAGEPGPVL